MEPPVKALLGGALSALLACGCGSSSEPGVSLRVVSRTVGLEAGTSVQNDLGFSFAVTTALFTNVAFEIVPCKSAARRLWDVAVPNARAHGVSTPTRLAVPRVEDAFATEPLELGELSPPAGRYCALSLEFGPADSDAEGLSVAPDTLGKSLLLRGNASSSSGTEGPFAIESALALEYARARARARRVAPRGHARRRARGGALVRRRGLRDRERLGARAALAREPGSFARRSCRIKAGRSSPSSSARSRSTRDLCRPARLAAAATPP